MSAAPLLEVRGLQMHFPVRAGILLRASRFNRAVDGVSLSIQPGETLGLVGESGCGKSVTAHSIMRLLPQPMGQIAGGVVRFRGREITSLSLEEMEKVRGRDIGMVFQEPMTALNPVHTVGKQLTEVMLLHRDIAADQAIRDGIELLARVGIPSPDVRMGEYPHQLSGGMRQRVVIAMALAAILMTAIYQLEILNIQRIFFITFYFIIITRLMNITIGYIQNTQKLY